VILWFFNAILCDRAVRILIIEDEIRITEILQETLTRAGFAVDSARRCAEAREALSLSAYDAAVLDLGLPDGDGRSLLADLQSSHNRVPVLILTARDTLQDRVSGLDAGADDYLVKPFATAEVIARLRALLRRPGGALGVTLQAGNVSFDTNRPAPPRKYRSYNPASALAAERPARSLGLCLHLAWYPRSCSSQRYGGGARLVTRKASQTASIAVRNRLTAGGYRDSNPRSP
jgi:CheY-like chemotaxis protein